MTSYGQLGRMTQFKDKGEGKEFVSAGLFTYPVLMAGDILLYQTTHVPIGDDQRQHLELARDVAERFNARRDVRCPGRDLSRGGGADHGRQGATAKMSTSSPRGAGVVRMLDDADVIRRKFKTAVTDSGREVRRAADKPGVTNLIDILSVATGETPEAIEARYDERATAAQSDVAEAVVELLVPIQARYRGSAATRQAPALLAQGADKAREASAPTLAAIYDRMGFAKL